MINLDDIQRGFDRWAAKPHNAKWVRKIDGTPIANDIVVNIFEELKDPAAEATEGGAHEKGWHVSPRGGMEPDWHEAWLKMRKNYNTLKHAAARVVAETDRIHDNEPWPLKYRAPYEAITILRAALTAKQTDGRGGE